MKTFQNLFPTQPSRLWSAPPGGLPDPAAWTGALVYGTDGALYLSTGTAWVKVGPTVVPPPTPWRGFSGYLLPPGNVALTLADLGKFVVANVALTLTLPPISTVPAGQGYHVQANGAVTLTAAAGNNVFKPTVGLAGSEVIDPTKSAWVISDGGATWVMSGTGA